MAGNRTIRRALESAGLLKRTRPAEALGRESSHDIAKAMPGEFADRSFSNSSGTRSYKLYVPTTYLGKRMPLIVMLHGCTQDPTDFAAGTGMNQLADQHGFLVVYPAQSAAANGMKCWNWFNENDQQRDGVEPSLIAGITREVAAQYNVDARRIFVAGLSAGASMAVIMGATYPDLFTAVGAHSGLPYRAAHDVSSALAAMRAGRAQQLRHTNPPARDSTQPAAATLVPTIVFHGDNDKTVNSDNGADIVEQFVSKAASLRIPFKRTTHERRAVNGREFTTTCYGDASEPPALEYWVLHGAGHAWSGGFADGSHTEESGPSASAEMVRFFFAQKKQV